MTDISAHSTLHRFLVRDLCASTLTIGSEIALPADEARHASNVLRMKAGDLLLVFDGAGHEWLAEATSVGKRDVTVQVREELHRNRELQRPITLAVALPKGDRQKTLVESLVQLGVTQLQPLECERSVAKVGDAVVERLQRAVQEASKQCGRNRLMEIAQPMTVSELANDEAWQCDTALSTSRQSLIVYAHPYGSAPPIARESFTEAESLKAVIGPEGGFTDPEVALMHDAGWSRLSLGPRILRVEVAAISLAAQWTAV